jgi:hypothetical protein
MKARANFIPAFFSSIVILMSVLPARAGATGDWKLAASAPSQYEIGDDTANLYQGHATRFLKSKDPRDADFGTLMMSVLAGDNQGKRVRLTGFVKSQDVKEWAGLWMRVDEGPKRAVAFDNMSSRAIKGTTDWKRYEVVLDVPPKATNISLGVLLVGAGEVWLSDAKLETVGTDVTVTSQTTMDDRNSAH